MESIRQKNAAFLELLPHQWLCWLYIINSLTTVSGLYFLWTALSAGKRKQEKQRCKDDPFVLYEKIK